MNKSAAISMTAITALLLIAVAVLSVFLSVSMQEQGQYRRMANNEYEQAYYRLSESMGNVRVNLDKARVVQDSAMMCELMTDISVSCEGAMQALDKFSADGYSARELSKFTNQVGDYCAYLHSKSARGEEVSASEREMLRKLSQTAALVQEKLSPVRDELGAGGFEFSKKIGALDEEFSAIMNALQDGSTEYPSLIYDGPFSDGLDDKKVKALEGGEITPQEGAEQVAEKLGELGIKGISYIGEGKSRFKTYLYSIDDEHGSGDVQIAAQGGKIVQFSFNCESGEKREFDAEENAVAFVGALGYEGMKPVWSAEADGIIYMNLCFEQEGVIVYPDMVKVKINARDGHVIGCETLSYLLNHAQRTLKKPTLSAKEISERDFGELEIESVRLALIPTPGGGERLTYEVYGKSEGEKFFVYADADTGAQVRVLMVVDGEQGELLI